MKNQRKMMPVGEINLEELNSAAKEAKQKILDEKNKVRDEIKKEIYIYSLYNIANDTNYCGVYSPYLLDFRMVLERIKDDNVYDEDEESLQIKIDLVEQISKMKEVPPLNTECHIESNKIGKSSSIGNLIRKIIFRDKKYRIIFHNKEAKYEKSHYESLFLKFLDFIAI